MPLGNTEKEGIKKILGKLKEEDLFSLVFTVTKGFIRTETKLESLEVILLYCETATALLNRRKIKKEIIISYLRDERIAVSVNSDKNIIVKECLKYWNSQELDNYEEMEQDTDEITDSAVERFEEAQVSNLMVKSQPNLSQCYEMGEHFVRWFFRLLNEAGESKSANESFGAEHFWLDIALKFICLENGFPRCGVIETAENVANFFKILMIANELKLDPSLQNVTTNFDAYGLVKIMSQGVVHKGKTSIGIFKQLFGLIRDPKNTDRWKIKFSELQIQVNCHLLHPLSYDEPVNVKTTH